MDKKLISLLTLAALTKEEFIHILECAIAYVENESPSSDGMTIDKARHILEVIND